MLGEKPLAGESNVSPAAERRRDRTSVSSMATNPDDHLRSPPQFSLKLMLILISISGFVFAVVRVNGVLGFFASVLFVLICWVVWNLVQLVRQNTSQSHDEEDRS